MKKLKFLFSAVMIVCAISAYSQKLNVATFNIRLKTPKDVTQGDGWDQRKPVVTNIIRYHDFDIFGTQEVLQPQLEDLLAGLPGYDYIGVARIDGKQEGEYSAIFYKKDMLKVLDSGTFWLAPDTEKPGKGWDAKFPRICTWGKFQDKASKKVFWFFNTHFDHVGKIARSESAKLITEKIKAMAGKDPVILTGDFNVDQKNECYAVMMSSGLMKDAYQCAEIRHAENGTINGFKTNTKTDSRIDHIYLTQNWKVYRYAVLTDSYWTQVDESGTAIDPGNFPKDLKSFVYKQRFPSDHFPVAAQLGF